MQQEEAESVLVKVSQEKEIILRSHQLSDVLGSIKSAVKLKLFKWDPELQACPLKAAKVQLSDTVGNMMDESSNVLAKVQMKLTVFKPSPGKLLTGIVVDTSSTHIDLLVYGLFNAVLKKEDIKRLTFINQKWFTEKSRLAVETDTALQFRVKQVKNELSGEFTIEGEIDMSKLTGLWEEIHPTFQLNEDAQAEIKDQISELYQKHTSSGISF